MIKKIYSLYCILWLAFLVFIFYILFLAVYLTTKNNQKKFNYFHKLIYTIFSSWYFMCGFKHAEVNNPDSSIIDKPAIFIANHTSYMDIPPLVLMNKYRLRILGKKEGLNIPIFSFIYNEFVVSFNRGKWRERVQVISKAKNILFSGSPMIIFPEGRFFNHPQKILNPFEKGAFELAIQTKLPIQPFIYLDSNKRLNPAGIFTFTKGINCIKFLPLVTLHLTQEMSTIELKEYCYNLIYQSLLENKL